MIEAQASKVRHSPFPDLRFRPDHASLYLS